MTTETNTTHPLTEREQWIFNLLQNKMGTEEPVTMSDIMAGDSPFPSDHNASMCVKYLVSKIQEDGYIVRQERGIGRSKLLKLWMDKRF